MSTHTWEEFLDYCNEQDWHPMGVEPAATDSPELVELLETGSVTLKHKGREIIVTLSVEETF